MSDPGTPQPGLNTLPLEPLFFGDYLFPENPSLQDLRQVFLLDKSSKQKDFHQSLQLHAHLMGLALAARVSRGLDLAYDHAHDAFKNKQRPDRRNEFVASFNYAYDETERILHHALAHPQPRPSFLDMMSQSSSTAILAFLHRIRTDPTILATAFKNLQSQELDGLLLPERSPALAHTQAHFGHRHTRERGNSMHTTSSQHQAPANSIHKQPPQGAIPNFVNNQDIVHIILGNLFGPPNFEQEHILRAKVVQTIFVTLLMEKKGERLMTEMLERYVTHSEWQHNSIVKAPFEKTLLALIQKGEQILAGFTDEELNANTHPLTASSSQNHHLQHLHHHHQSLGRMASVPLMKAPLDDSTMPASNQQGSGHHDSSASAKTVESRASLPELTARQAVVEDFFTEACLRIMDALKEFSPPGLMQLSQMIFAELDNSAKSYASLIIVVKFFFYRFMNKCIAYPETYGMMQEVFISEKQRQRILFTTHQRLYRHVTNILNPVPGWESRSLIIDTRIRESIDGFVSLFSASSSANGNTSSQYTLNPVAELSTSAPVPAASSRPSRTGIPGTKASETIPYLLLCPSDFTTLLYFVCPQLRTAHPGFSSHSSSTSMTRSSSFNGKSVPITRQRTSSETPPTYPAAMKSAAAASGASAGSSSTATGAVHPPGVARAHKRASPSFSFFSGATSSLPFKAKPPPPLTLEKYPTAPAGDSSYHGSTFLTLSGIKPGQAALPQTATVEVTSSSGIAAASSSCILPSDSKAPSAAANSTTPSSSTVKSVAPAPTPKHWNDEILMPDLKAAIQELRKIQPGFMKESPWAVTHSSLTPLREPWALVYVEYGDAPNDPHASGSDQDDGVRKNSPYAETALALAPSCMAMAMETSSMGGSSRIVTVTKPMLVDQVMDSAGGHDHTASSLGIDLEVDESDADSIISSEDKSLAKTTHYLTSEDKGMSILRVNSSQMLSSGDRSGSKSVPGQGSARHGEHPVRVRNDDGRTPAMRRIATDRAWKIRIRQTVHSEADMPEEVITVARSIFKILREFDLATSNEFHESQFGYPSTGEKDHRSIQSLLVQGIEQARLFGNHGAAIGFHHSLRVLESSPILRQLDSSKLIYLLAMPIKHRLEHRAGRARSRTMWESFAHSWHMRLVSAIERKRENISALRIKMYYQTCVRTSRSFDRSFGVVVSLSRSNKAALRRYQPSEEWECQHGGCNDLEMSSGIECDPAICKDTCEDHSSHRSDTENTTGSHGDKSSKRYSVHNGLHAHALRTAKVRRSSFSSYIDNVTSHSFGSHSYLESSLGHLKEKEQATFSSSYNPTHQGMLWGNSNSNSSNSGSQTAAPGSLGDAIDLPSDFNMDTREVEAVQRWIQDTGIHNFLPGEDNFLRFCMEVESVVRCIGLGGTGIHGAGIPQTVGTISSSGSDFFIKEVAKFNGQFVAGMGPTDVIVQTKSGSTSGVAEFIVNSLKNGHIASPLPTPTGTHFFSTTSTASSAASTNGPANSGSSYGSQSSPTSLHSPVNGIPSGGKSKAMLRQILHNNNQGSPEAIPSLPDDPSSIYATPVGPTYALYNPPYSITTHGTSSYSGSSAPGGAPSTVSPHQLTHLPKDMTEFLRRMQLRLTSFVLSEWLELFGEVETDRWFVEFMDEIRINRKAEDGGAESVTDEQEDCLSAADANQDGDFLPANQMDLRDKPSVTENGLHHRSPETFASVRVAVEVPESARRMSVAKSSLASGELAGPLGVNSSWRGPCDDLNSLSDEKGHSEDKQQRQLGFQPESVARFDTERKRPVSHAAHSTTPKAESSVRNVSSFSSIRRESLNHPSAQEECPSQPRPGYSGRSLLDTHVRSLGEKRALKPVMASSAEPYDLAEAFQSTIDRFSQTSSPYQKLGHLYALVQLIAASLSYPDSCTTGGAAIADSQQETARESHTADGSRPLSSHSRASFGNKTVVEEFPPSPRAFTPGTDAIVSEIEKLMRQGSILRPRNLLRDLQLIATFVPGSILDLRDDGKAFWDMTVAISGLKGDVIEYVVKKGTQFVEVEESTRTSQENERSGCRPMPHDDDDDERTRMAEAVRLFTIGAKESHAVAQRELAILYMSLPTLPSTSTPPLGYLRADGSPLVGQTGRVPSPITISTSRFGKPPLRTNTPPPPSPMGTSFLGKSVGTASIPIKQKPRHQHSSSGSGSSFGSGVLNGLGIMSGLGSFTGSSSMGSGGSEGPNNSSTASLHQHQLHQREFADGHHDVEHYHEVHQTGRQSASGAVCMVSQCSNRSLHPNQYQQQQQQRHQQQLQQQQQQHSSSQNAGDPPNSSGPDKFNPENVAAAMHWFSLAAAQGDQFSINYLKHKETAGGMLSNIQ
ncbi:hypothetical protein BGZ75_004894 [Mortierella antarctica]|nr:hypothetical protein BGZ75_004894 [Mortierella antarctica]